MKKGMGKNKGSTFERWVCKRLSLWWSNGDSDDIFYRTASSGGRATQRAHKGKRTVNHYGDVSASDPEGYPLLNYVTIELKRGYPRCTLHDLLDTMEGVQCGYEKWFEQAEEDHDRAGVHSWWLITRRDRHEPILFTPKVTLVSLTKDNIRTTFLPFVEIHYTSGVVAGVRLEQFLDQLSPTDIIASI